MNPADGESTTAAVGATVPGPIEPATWHSATIEFEPGEALGRYRLSRILGRGGMGVVYAAFDPDLDRAVALKVLRPRSRQSGPNHGGQARLVREAQAMASLCHENVIAVYDVGRLDDRVYIAMELIEGQDLRRWLNRSQRPWAEVLDRLLEAGQGLAAAHSHGIVHRDFKPANVLVGDDGRVRVLDFGLARSIGPASSASAARDAEASNASNSLDPSREATGSRTHALPALTEEGAVMGTPAYMAPEHSAGDPIDERADQYSYCVTLYEALYGERPFSGDTTKERARNARLGRIRPSPSNTAVPTGLRRALIRGLAADPEQRWPNMDSLLRQLRRDRAPTRHPGAWVGLAAVIGAVAVVQTPSAPEACEQGDLEIAEIWNDDVSEQAGTEFTVVSPANGADTWKRVAGTLNQYAQTWAEHRRATCETAHSVIRDRRLACFRQHKAELGALVELLSSPDPSLVRDAVEAARRLSPISACTSINVERGTVAPPLADIAEEVQQLREELSSLVVFRDAGRFERAEHLGQTINRRASALGYAPLEAEALYRHAKTEEGLARYNVARSRLERAFYKATECGHDLIAAQAAMDLTFDSGYRTGDLSDYQTWRGHAQAALRRIPDDLAPPHRARLAQVIGSVALRRGDFEEADEVLGQAYDLAVAAYGSSHLQVASLLINRSVAQVDLGDFDASRASLQQSLSITEDIVGHLHPDVASAHENLGVVAQQQGQLEVSLDHFNEAFEIQSVVFGVEHFHQALTLNNIGTTLALMGRHEDAKTHFERSIKIYDAHERSDPIDAARPIGNLGRTLHHLGNPQDGLPYLHRAVELVEAAAGAEHAGLGPLLFNLAMAYHALHEVDEALTHLRRTLAIERKIYGERHPNIAATMTAVADIELERGRPVEAASLLEQSLAIQREFEGDPATVAGTSYSLARALWERSEHRGRATELAREAEELYTELGERGAPWVREIQAWRLAHGAR